MVLVAEKEAKGEGRRRKSSSGFKGVRMRNWGRWVSEIRVPRSRSRVWLGSYDAPEKAARAYDAALYCLRGPGARFNFPGERRPEFPGGMPPLMPKSELKAIAASFSFSDDPTAGLNCLDSTCMSFLMAASKESPSLPQLPASTEIGSSGCEAGSAFMASAGGFRISNDGFSPENLCMMGEASSAAYAWDVV
ncbi:hypothetical protein ACLOJK_020753, partial [Asimina triloba]